MLAKETDMLSKSTIASLILAAGFTGLNFGCASHDKKASAAGMKSEACCNCATKMDKKDTYEKEGAKDDNKDESEDSKYAPITAAELPPAVAAAFAKAYPGVTAEKIKKETYKDGNVHYEFEFKGKDGKDAEVHFASDGEQLEAH